MAEATQPRSRVCTNPPEGCTSTADAVLAAAEGDAALGVIYLAASLELVEEAIDARLREIEEQ